MAANIWVCSKLLVVGFNDIFPLISETLKITMCVGEEMYFDSITHQNQHTAVVTEFFCIAPPGREQVEKTFPFHSAQQTLTFWSQTLEGILSWHRTLRGPGLDLNAYVVYRTKEIQGHCQVSYRLALRSQDTIKISLQKPWLCVWSKHTCYHWSKSCGGGLAPIVSLPFCNLW